MEINSDGVQFDTSASIMAAFNEFLKDSYGSTFKIKGGGVLEGLLEDVIKKELNLQAVIKYLVSQYSPDAVEGRWEDALFERIGLSRGEPQPSKITVGLNGSALCKIKANEVLIRDNSGFEFLNSSDFFTNEVGFALVDFYAVEFGNVNIDSNTEFNIVRAPDSIYSIDNTSVSFISEGSLRESDYDYKIRYGSSKANNSRATYSANMAYLAEYVSDLSYLMILDRNSDSSIPANAVRIIVKTDVSDNVFAKAILNTFGMGILFMGTTTVNLPDIKGIPVDIKFCRATDMPLIIKAGIKIVSGYYDVDVVNNAKLNILDYINRKAFGLGSIVYATEFIVPLLKTEGVSSVEEIEIKNVSDSEYTNVIQYSVEEVPIFSFENINIERR